MKKNTFYLQKILVVVFLSCTNITYAGTAGTVCKPETMTVPCKHTAWEFEIQALYLKPTYSLGSFTTNYINGLTNDSTDVVAKFNSPKFLWAWGFNIEGFYLYSTGSDIKINWYHYSRSTNQVITNGPNVIDSVYDVISNFAFFSTIDSRLETKWDAVNLEFGHL